MNFSNILTDEQIERLYSNAESLLKGVGIEDPDASMLLFTMYALRDDAESPDWQNDPLDLMQFFPSVRSYLANVLHNIANWIEL